MDDFVTRAALAVAGTAVGLVVLLFGRRYTSFLLGVIIVLVSSYFLATLLGLENEVELILTGQWQALLGVLAAAGLVAYVGHKRSKLATTAIGFIAGVYIATFFDQLLLHLFGQTTTSIPWWVFVIFLLAGLAGVYLVRRNPDEALIIISVVLGVAIVNNALNLDQESSWTAVIILSLSLVGILFQYASYLRELPRRRRVLPAVPAPDSEDLPYQQV